MTVTPGTWHANDHGEFLTGAVVMGRGRLPTGQVGLIVQKNNEIRIVWWDKTNGALVTRRL